MVLLLCSPVGEYVYYFKFAHPSTLLNQIQSRILFEGCYFGATFGSVKIAKVKLQWLIKAGTLYLK